MERPKDLFVTKYIVTCNYKGKHCYLQKGYIVPEMAEATIYDTERDAESVASIMKWVYEFLPEFETKVVPYDVWGCAL